LLRGDFRAVSHHVTALAIRNRLWVMGGVVLSIVITGAIYFFVLEKEFVGESEQKEFVVFVELPAGTKLDVSDKVVAAVEREISDVKEIASSIKTVSARVEGWSSKIYVTLVPQSERTKSTQDVIDDLRPRFKSIGQEYEAFVYFSEPSRSKEFVIDCYGNDYLQLRDMAVEIAKRMEQVKGFRDVKLRYKPGRPEVRLAVDLDRAAMFGLTTRDVADSMHAQIRGLRATYFNTGDDQVETVARLSEEDRRTLEQVNNLSIVARDRKKTVVPVQQVIDIKNGFTPSEVWRKNKERMIQVSANRERISLSAAVFQVKKNLLGMHVPVGYYYEIGGDYKKLVRSEKEFVYAFIVMLALVFMVLACFFESYSQPLLMLLTLPLATAGSMPLLWATDTPVNMGVYMGLLMLGGTVTANGIILIDRLNTMRKTDGLLRSVMKVGHERSRPIFMTSLTTICGMLPLAIKKGGSAEMWVPFALTVVSGIAVSSVLSIFVIPAAYVVLEDVKKRFKP
jgi:HAE1 family hydrophobic/amphiphilic exporter-1